MANYSIPPGGVLYMLTKCYGEIMKINNTKSFNKKVIVVLCKWPDFKKSGHLITLYLMILS